MPPMRSDIETKNPPTNQTKKDTFKHKRLSEWLQYWAVLTHPVAIRKVNHKTSYMLCPLLGCLRTGVAVPLSWHSSGSSPVCSQAPVPCALLHQGSYASASSQAATAELKELWDWRAESRLWEEGLYQRGGVCETAAPVEKTYLCPRIGQAVSGFMRQGLESASLLGCFVEWTKSGILSVMQNFLLPWV